MKTILFAGMAMAGIAMAGTASADHHGDKGLSAQAEQFRQGCVSFQMEYGGNTDCTCLAAAYDADEDFAAEMNTIMGPEDVESLSDAALEQIADCEEE